MKVENEKKVEENYPKIGQIDVSSWSKNCLFCVETMVNLE